MEIKVFNASPKDAFEIRQVFYKTWLATYPNEDYGITIDDIEDFYKDKFTEESINKLSESIENLEAKEFFKVAKDNDKIVGICSVVESEDSFRLKAIYVLPEYQNNGIGKKLWDEVRKKLTAGKSVLVSLAEYNKNAISFYEKLGFKDTGKRFRDDRFKMKSGSIIPEIEMVMENR